MTNRILNSNNEKSTKFGAINLENFTKDELKNFVIGISVILICLFLATVYKLQNNVWKGQDNSDYTLYATFNRTDGLVIGDHVRMAGIDVGRVIGSKLDENFRAILTLNIDSGITIPDDSSISIVSSGITGNKYVEIDPGGSEDFLAPNCEFIYTQDAMVLEELIDRVISMGKANRKKACKTKEQENTNNEENI